MQGGDCEYCPYLEANKKDAKELVEKIQDRKAEEKTK